MDFPRTPSKSCFILTAPFPTFSALVGGWVYRQGLMHDDVFEKHPPGTGQNLKIPLTA